MTVEALNDSGDARVRTVSVCEGTGDNGVAILKEFQLRGRVGGRSR